MDAKEAFSVAIRVVGLLSLGRCVTDLAFVATYLIGNENISVTAKFPGADFVIGVFFLLAGLYLLRGAPWIVNFAFPGESPSQKDASVNED
jgi:hypothetical protein